MTCRFEKKEMSDWTIEGPRHIARASVISANHYELPVVNPQIIADLARKYHQRITTLFRDLSKQNGDIRN